ncbi:hypothetical protein [Paractinoplanes atraurantiacus]|uniref:HEAT repeat-containing protein n=1 Tax=Paractinoplanes atraurantiacus TaxID=1036182 RepID=A0A285KT84_9ACTN|nr:hypothetical protein [Actinoplanes atraurantiacus]SNY74471.1 hypothetical protein SAMN05421748_1521 [Actinoplanes atraurantiacus]
MSAVTWRLDARRSYLAHARVLAGRHGPGPWPDGGEPLPDAPEAPPLLSDTVLDGIRAHHTALDDGHDSALALAELIRTVPVDLRALHDAAALVAPLEIADDLVDQLRALHRDDLRTIGRWLAENGTMRSAVALGIILLGVAGDERDRELLLLLGALELLTLYAVVALRNTQPDHDRAVFEMARRVDGWGRIHAVERLTGSADPRIRAWLLRDGFRNRILDEYLAYIAAATGDLAGALAADTIDEALLDGAGDILLALARGGPAEDMRDYTEAPLAIGRYLHHAGRAAPTLHRIGIVGALQRFGADEGWQLAQRCADLTDRPDWRAVLDEALASAELEKFHEAIWPAEQVGRYFTDRLRWHLSHHPYDRTLWFSLLDHHDVGVAVELATRLLPLADLATGPGLVLEEYGDTPSSVLDLVVSRLPEHPGTGSALVRTALSNATVRNRHMALNALETWPPEDPPVGDLRAAEALEPDDELRERLRAQLRRHVERR